MSVSESRARKGVFHGWELNPAVCPTSDHLETWRNRRVQVCSRPARILSLESSLSRRVSQGGYYIAQIQCPFHVL